MRTNAFLTRRLDLEPGSTRPASRRWTNCCSSPAYLRALHHNTPHPSKTRIANASNGLAKDQIVASCQSGCFRNNAERDYIKTSSRKAMHFTMDGRAYALGAPRYTSREWKSSRPPATAVPAPQLYCQRTKIQPAAEAGRLKSTDVATR